MSTVDYSFTYPKSKLNPTGEPLPTQKLFHQSSKQYRLLAGGFGTGKTTSIGIEVQKDIAIPNNYILMGRKDMMEFKNTTLQELLDLTPPHMIQSHNKEDNLITFINSSIIKYDNLDVTKGAFNKIKSYNLGACYIDQLEEIDEKIYTGIIGRLRRNNARRNFVGSCNPEGHDWCWRRWKQLPFEQFVKEMNFDMQKVMITLAIIRKRSLDMYYDKRKLYNDLPFDKVTAATLNDKYKYGLFETNTLENIYLPADYIEGLLAMPKKFVDRYVYCSWDDYSGLVYNEFNNQIHVIDDYTPTGNERLHLILDYGYKVPTGVLYIAVLPPDKNGKSISVIYDETYNIEKRISENAEEIKTKCPNHRRAIRRADPSIWRTERDGKCIADDYASNGLFFMPADNEVRQGIDRVNEMLFNREIFVTRKCRNFLEEVGDYKWKELRAGMERDDYEEPRKKKDHLMDCLRYFANYKYRPPTELEKKEVLELSVEISDFKSVLDY
jgi:PBSX family phage terminase large subunit